MGLSISCGVLLDALDYDREYYEYLKGELEKINIILEHNHLNKFIEPEKIDEEYNSNLDGFPYSYLHYLRRVYALYKRDEKIISIKELTDSDFNIIDDESSMFDSHLLCHSDCEGYYLPVDFEEVIFDESAVGGMIGSSYRLLDEIMPLAELIDIKLDSSKITKQSYDDIVNDMDEHPFYRERLVWLTLYEACNYSIKNRCLINFN